MKKLLLTLVAASAVLIGFNSTAKAGWSVNFSYSEGGGYYQPRHYSRPVYHRPARVVYHRPVYVQPRRVVYVAPQRVYCPPPRRIVHQPRYELHGRHYSYR